MQNPNFNPQDFEIIETGHLSLNLSFKSLKSKPNPHLIERIQSLLASQNTEKYIEKNKLFVGSEGKTFEFGLFPETNIGTTLLFSKTAGFIGSGDRGFRVDLRNCQKMFEEPHLNEENMEKNKEYNENKGNLRLESITEWLNENRPKIKKRKRNNEKEASEKSEEEEKKEEIAKKPIKKRKKNINSLLSRVLS